MRKHLKVLVPESLDEVTIGQYQRWAEVASTSEGSLFLIQKTVEIFCDMPLTLIAKMSKKQLDVVVGDLMTILQEPRKELVKRFKFGGIEYGFMPHLEEMTAGEWIDLEEYLKSWNTLDKAISILYRPITVDLKDKWMIQEYDGVKDDRMKGLSASVGLDAVFFLISLLKVLEKDSAHYLQSQLPKLMKIPKIREILTENGVGFMQSIPSLSTPLTGWLLLPVLQLRSSLPFLSTKKKKQTTTKKS